MYVSKRVLLILVVSHFKNAKKIRLRICDRRRALPSNPVYAQKTMLEAFYDVDSPGLVLRVLTLRVPHLTRMLASAKLKCHPDE